MNIRTHAAVKKKKVKVFFIAALVVKEGERERKLNRKILWSLDVVKVEKCLFARQNPSKQRYIVVIDRE